MYLIKCNTGKMDGASYRYMVNRGGVNGGDVLETRPIYFILLRREPAEFSPSPRDFVLGKVSPLEYL